MSYEEIIWISDRFLKTWNKNRKIAAIFNLTRKLSDEIPNLRKKQFVNLKILIRRFLKNGLDLW